MNIVIAAHLVFPTNTAGGSRIRYIAKGLQEIGHNVSVIAMAPLGGLDSDSGIRKWHQFKEIVYYPAGGIMPTGQSTMVRRKNFTKACLQGLAETIRCIEQLHKKKKIDVVIGYNTRFFNMHGLVKYCKRKYIAIVRDVVEFTRPSSFHGGCLHPAYWDSELNKLYSLPQSDGIIAISKFLADKYSAKVKDVIRVPAIIDPDGRFSQMSGLEKSISDVFLLTYLGDMERRDGPMIMMQAIRGILESGTNILFNIIGTDGTHRTHSYARKAIRYVENHPSLRSKVKFLGRVTDEEVVAGLSRSDALIFNRIPGKAAQAAFPTRLPEYLTTARPVIASGVGDIPEYLIDGKEAIVVKPDSVAALSEGINRLIHLPDHGKAIGLAGREKCRQCFNYRTHCAKISIFLEELVSKIRTNR